jgi:hypothetical protein
LKRKKIMRIFYGVQCHTSLYQNKTKQTHLAEASSMKLSSSWNISPSLSKIPKEVSYRVGCW